uniref:Uncharacterized protein n=1 Tax=Heterorhabditis bacteriophora TaxID=37862 RepID=A0A1I7WGV3_HETBA
MQLIYLMGILVNLAHKYNTSVPVSNKIGFVPELSGFLKYLCELLKILKLLIIRIFFLVKIEVFILIIYDFIVNISLLF